jgi:Small-conductance mechanosensitive channel
MLETQEQAKATDAVRMTISGEAMELSRKVREMERATRTDIEHISSELAEEDLYDELFLQVRIWGDATANIRNQYDYEETKELAEKQAAALTELQKLEQLQKSEISKQEKEAQKAAELAAVQQEKVNKKSSELIIMIESFEEQENDEEQSERTFDQKDTQEKKTESNSNLMEGKIGASAARRELGMLGTISQMEESAEYNLMTNIQSINGLLDERNSIYKMNNEPSIGIQEKIKAMSDYVATLVNPEMMQQYFDERIGTESDENTREKLSMMYDYFMSLDMKNGIENLSKDRAHALQEKRNAKDLRIAHIGSRHLVMAEQQKKELQSLFDEDDILRAQGQGNVADHTEEVTERLQERLDERDRIDEDNEESIKEETIEEILSKKEQLEKEED